MNEFEHITAPPGHARRLIKGMIHMGFCAFLLLGATIFLGHNKDSAREAHEDHLACLFIHDNPLIFAGIMIAVLFWIGVTNR